MKTKFTIILLLLNINLLHAQGLWEEIATFPGTTRHAAGSFSLNGEGYVIGGYGSNSQVLNDVWKYNPQNDLWSLLDTLPIHVYGSTVFVLNDTVYMCNGWQSTAGVTNDILFRYDPILDVWDSINTYPGTPAYTCVSFVLNGKAYIGIGYQPYTNELWQYDPSTNTWTAKADFAGSMRQSCAAFVINNKAFVGLGADNNEVFDDIYEYVDSSDTWVLFDTFPGGGRYANTSMVINNKAYIGNGYDLMNFKNDMWELDPTSLTWTQVNDFGGAERHSVCSFVINNIGYTGLGVSGFFQGDFWRLIPDGLNEISGRSYYDLNSNSSFDSSEYPISQLLVQVNPGGDIYSTNNLGVFRAQADTAISYTFNVLNVPQYYSLNTTLPTISFSSTGNLDSSIVLPLQPTNSVQDLYIDLTPLTPVRGGFDGFYAINYKNKGTLLLDSAMIHLTLDTGLSFLTTMPNTPYSAINANGDSIVWTIYNLQPGESGTFRVKYSSNFVQLLNGDTVICSAVIYPTASDADTVDNYSFTEEIVVGSYDPNDKAVSDATITPAEVLNGKWLTYTIRFQNTGTFQANYVRVIDSIPTSLDLSTFEMISASHDFTYEITGDRAVKWNFPGIVLPDSNANEPESHGFIKFRIKPISSLVIGNQIDNNAFIYFDFNPPVITNYAQTIVTNPAAISEISKNQNWILYPNPAKDVVNISKDIDLSSIATIQLYDASGRFVAGLPKPISHLIALPKMNTGIYQFTILMKDGQSISRNLFVR